MLRTLDPIRACATAVTICLAMAACRDIQAPSSDTPDSGSVPEPRAELTDLIVSNPGATAWVNASLPPGSMPAGEHAIIRNRSSGAQVIATMTDGGFDPVALPAAAGDTLDIAISETGTTSVLAFMKRVPERTPPAIVRTSPPPKKRDVPLNTVIVLVFSEPLDQKTLTPASLQLQLNGQSVAGTLGVDSTGLVVTFTPAAPLLVNSAYTVVATQAILDLDGDQLNGPVTVGFVTQPDLSGVAGTYERLTPHSIPGYYSRYVFRDDGNFELQYETPTFGNFSYTGRYAVVNDSMTLDFDGWSLAGPWQATGTIAGDSVVVAYNIVMQLSDFEDGVYIRSTSASLPPADLVFSRAGNLYLINADGTLLRQLTSDALGQDYGAVWSPDGNRIAFTRYRSDLNTHGEAAIYLVNSDGTGLVRLSAAGPDVWDESPSWSPDGSRIAFITRRDDPHCNTVVSPVCIAAQEVYAMDADGSGPVRLTSLQTLLNHPAWSPDGSRIAFLHTGTWNISIMQADGSNLLPILTGDSVYPPAWSPDGSRILTRTATCLNWVDSGQGGLDCTAYDGPYLVTTDPDGSNAQRLAGYVLSSPDWLLSAPTWSPDALRLAFSEKGCAWPEWSSCGEPEQIKILDVATGQVVLLTEGTSPDWRR